MANEAAIIELLGDGGDPIRFTVADGATILKGSILVFGSDPNTVVVSSALTERFAGIAAAEKVISDGATEMAAFTKGIFDLRCGGQIAVSIGDRVTLSAANTVEAVDIADDIINPTYGLSGQAIVGVAMEDVALGTPETIRVAIGVYT